jgi:hypothetical protein
MLWDVPTRPNPKWEGMILDTIACQVAVCDVYPVMRDTALLREALATDVRKSSLKRVRVTITVEELE